MLTTLILAAGESRRFREKYGENFPPKQFIKFQATRNADPWQMWENSIRSLSLDTAIYGAFQKRHSNYMDREQCRPTNFVWLPPTRGQADTLAHSLRLMGVSGELLVVNCDNGFGHGTLNRLVHEGRFHKTIAAVTMQKTDERRWSFTDSHPTFHEAAEKRMLSPFALAGAYYFPDADEALYAAERAVDSAFTVDEMLSREDTADTRYVHLQEPYISGMFKWIPEPKLSVEIDPDDFYDWGTPDTLNGFVQWMTR